MLRESLTGADSSSSLAPGAGASGAGNAIGGALALHPVTLRDIALKVGVSYVTVSFALRDCGRVSEKMRVKIKKVAEEMGYRPDPTARALVEYRRHKRTTSIHAAIAWINLWKNPQALRSYREFDLYWKGAFAAADEAGYRLEEFRAGPELSLTRLEKIFITRNIHGIIIPPHGSGFHTEGFDWDKFSAVRIGHSVSWPQVHVVTPDQVGNAILAFRRMTELGYERIGFVAMADVRAEPRTWTGGGFYMMQLRNPAKSRIPPLIMQQENSPKEQKQFEAWLVRYKPDAILTEIPSVRTMLEKAGRKIPDDIGVATLSVLDGNFDAGIDQNPELIGKAASEILIALINRNELGSSPDHRTSSVKGKWVDGTTLPPKTVQEKR